jgi:BirA family transcriptional regulator, biotin operon repressor / biotin---[acetyl-CoA-carboxylase] ligase
MASDLSDEILERALVGRFGRYRRVYDSIDSTNLEALRWAAEQGAAEGSLVVADSQTEGRGRWGRSWLSQPGAGLLFSVVLRPKSLEPGLLTTAGGLAVARAVEEECDLPTLLKWPNDVLIGERKVSGILVESRSVGHAGNAAVLGVGINLYGRPDDWPAEIAAGATSIAQEVESIGSSRVPARAELLGSVLRHLQSLYDRMSTQEGGAEIVEQAGARSAILGRAVMIRFADGSSAEGIASALAPDGALLLDDGTAVTAGEIERLRPS